MWTALSLLLLLFGGMLAFSLGRRFFVSKSKLSLPKLDTFSAIFLCTSMLLGGIVLYGFSPDIPVYTGVVMMLLIWGLFFFSRQKFSLGKKALFQIAICALGVFGVLMPLPEMSLLYWVTGIILIISWAIGWHLFCTFDKYPMTSHLVSGGWTTALLVTCCIIRSFPAEIGIYAAILGISIFTISTKRLSYFVYNLGGQTAEIAGFIWSGIWTICLLKINVTVLLLVYGYYLMELFILTLRRIHNKPEKTLLMCALENTKRRKKAILTVISHIFVMAFLVTTLTAFGANTRLTIYSSLIFTLMICYDLYNQLNELEHPIGSWKQIFSTLKAGLSTLPKASKDFAKEVKSGLKTQKRRKKATTKKSTAKRKGTKKKK